jgi:hypothetical protein
MEMVGNVGEDREESRGSFTSSCSGSLRQSKHPHFGPQNFSRAKQSQYL